MGISTVPANKLGLDTYCIRISYSEYGVYETRKSECALIRHKAATYPIPMAGALATGVAKLPYTHEILDAKP